MTLFFSNQEDGVHSEQLVWLAPHLNSASRGERTLLCCAAKTLSGSLCVYAIGREKVHVSRSTWIRNCAFSDRDPHLRIGSSSASVNLRNGGEASEGPRDTEAELLLLVVR